MPPAPRARNPRDEALLRPTAFGSVLAATREYAWISYVMGGILWWPRLMPLLPGDFQALMGGAQAPRMALLNLSVVFSTLGPVAVVSPGFVGGRWTAAFVALAGALLLARLCHLAAVGQAAEVASFLRVAFDLYRHEILKQMDRAIPDDFAAERAPWRSLDDRLLDLPARPPAVSQAQAQPMNG